MNTTQPTSIFDTTTSDVAINIQIMNMFKRLMNICMSDAHKQWVNIHTNINRDTAFAQMLTQYLSPSNELKQQLETHITHLRHARSIFQTEGSAGVQTNTSAIIDKHTLILAQIINISIENIRALNTGFEKAATNNDALQFIISIRVCCNSSVLTMLTTQFRLCTYVYDEIAHAYGSVAAHTLSPESSKVINQIYNTVTIMTNEILLIVTNLVKCIDKF